MKPVINHRFAFTQSELAIMDSEWVSWQGLKETDRCILIEQQTIAIQNDSPFLSPSSLRLNDTHQLMTLGEYQNCRILWIQNDQEIHSAENAQYMDLRQIATELNATEASICAQALLHHHWHKNHQFCGHCGNPTQLFEEHARKCLNSTCQKVVFPRIDPAIIVAVTNEYDEILLGRQAHWDKDRYSVLAGFVSYGESLEGAVKREVAEESGVEIEDVKQIEYVASQPWPFPNSLMLGFKAKAKKQPINTVDDELEHAMWISRYDLNQQVSDGILKLPSRLSISRFLIDQWLID